MTPGFWGLTLEQYREILAVHRRGRLYPQKTQHRRSDVVGRGEIVARFSGPRPFGMADKEDDVRDLRPQRVGGFADDAVFAVGDAMVGDDHEQRIIEELELRDSIEEVAQPAVGHRDLSGVEGIHASELPLGETGAAPLGRRVGFETVVVAVVERDVLLGRVSGRVRVVAVHHQEERLPRPILEQRNLGVRGIHASLRPRRTEDRTIANGIEIASYPVWTHGE